MTRWWFVLQLGCCFAAATSLADATSLAGRLHNFIDRNGFPTFGDFNEAVTPIVQRLAVRGIDFPVTSTAPSFTYRYNFELGVPERSSDSLGPTFAERANTVGRHRFGFDIPYLYADLTDRGIGSRSPST